MSKFSLKSNCLIKTLSLCYYYSCIVLSSHLHLFYSIITISRICIKSYSISTNFFSDDVTGALLTSSGIPIGLPENPFTVFQVGYWKIQLLLMENLAGVIETGWACSEGTTITKRYLIWNLRRWRRCSIQRRCCCSTKFLLEIISNA